MFEDFEEAPEIPEKPVENKPEKPVENVKKTVEDVAKEVIRGDWGVGKERYYRLSVAGYDYDKVQAKVNEMLYGKAAAAAPEKAPEAPAPEKSPEAPEKSVEQVAREVIRGEWGNGQRRVDLLTAAGYDYDEVQGKVNELIYGK